MTSAIPTAPVQTKPTSSISVPSQNTSRNTSPIPAVPAQLPKASYANATKPATPAAINPQAPIVSSTGAQAPVQHGKVDTHSSTGPMSASSPSVGNPQSGIASGNNQNDFSRQDSHGRKPSVVISASGASGQIPNGGPVGRDARPNIAFGSMMNNQGSPAIASSSPAYPPQNNSLPVRGADPRVTSPAHSPSPIPQPPASGGKPPSGISNQGNGLVFGSSGMENGDANLRASQGPLTPSQQPAHLRRESSQSAHSNMSGVDMANRPFVPPNGRGRGYMQPYGGPHSPAMNYRQPSNQRGPPNMPGQFQNQPGMNNSPYGRGRGSPAMMHVQPHMPQGMPPGQHGMPYGAYPQHLGPQQYQQMYMGGMNQYDPNAGYYQPFYPQQGYHGAPPSPRPGQQYPSAYGGPPQNQSPYHPPSMSRSGSQMSERPASSLGSRPPTTASNVPPTPTPQSNTPTTPSVSSNFVKPQKVSKAIVIKNAAGEEITFDKKPSPAPAATPVVAAPAPPQSPAIVSSAPTPPPRTPSTTNQHNRTESRSAKTDAEVKNSFQEQVKRQLEAQKEAERKKSGGDATPAAAEKPTEAAVPEVNTPATKAEEKPKVAEEKAKATEAAKEAQPKSDTEAASQADNARAVTEAESAAAPAVPKESAEDEAARKKRGDDEEMERMIAEMEAAEKEEEERERKHQEKKKAELEEKKKREAEAKLNEDAELKRQEREAEELELKREKEREDKSKGKTDEDLFAALKKPTLGPGANASAELEAEAETPATEDAPSPTEPVAVPARAAGGQKPKPGPLKLRTDKPVEPAQPTPGMQALKTARLLDVQRESINYPDGIKSPNPALNTAGKQKGFQYDKSFLLQFQEVFKEKPTVDWDQKVKDTLGDTEPGSARPSASRQSSVSMGSRQPSNRGSGVPYNPMGSFGGPARTLPPGTTSADRFNAAQQGNRPMGAMGGFGSGRGGFPMGQPMSRQGSLQPMGQGGNPPSPRPGASRGRGSRRDAGGRNMSRKEEAKQDSSMPLTAGMELKGLEKSQSGWTARSLTQGQAAANVGPDGMMAPDMVQRKVKAALNKMTPEKFDKISDQIMEIANQSKNETDGRTLRQVIQLTFEKACDEAHWAGMYAKFCQKMLTQMSNEIKDETIVKNGQPVTGGGLFRKYLLNRCQEEFERGWEANLPEKPEGETEEAALLSDEYYIAAAAKRRGLGLIQFIGELYKLGMLTYRIMHQCVLRLLNFEGQPDESAVENLCRLLRTVGGTMDNSDEQGHGLVNAYFERINAILEQNKDMPSRPRFMLMDVIDLRKKGWQDKVGQKGPKTIQEIRAEAEAAQAAAEAERQKTNQRGPRMPAGRGDARSFSSQGMPPPSDYNRNQVGMDDLRRLQQRKAQPGQSGGGLGPSLGPGSSLFAGRSGSGRKGLGPPRDGDASGNTSRTNTPPAKKEDKEANSQMNSFSALAALENEGSEAAARSPPSEKASPAVSKATPSIDAASNAPNGA
ncbi:MIF4G domain-containing protein 2 [Elsinoe australis]|uniref:MIF4G domain-containing protein 2 n=1 Tax=Elsinoe australis TaxID=40998 RepID=A0A4V6DUZ6_9PEZI|nr:MIF4G domain-containing protein 2 [Elsinoe australis]